MSNKHSNNLVDILSYSHRQFKIHVKRKDLHYKKPMIKVEVVKKKRFLENLYVVENTLAWTNKIY